MAEPKGTQTWTVDASAMGAKGMFWRTHCGDDKFLTRPSDGKPGFVSNGERFRGVEEYRGWVVNVATQKWLPIRDAPAAGASAIDDVAHRRGVAPVGRGKFARDANMQPIPYLHAEDCGCGGAYCPKPKEAAVAEAAPRRRKPLEYVRPPPPPCVPVVRQRSFSLASVALCAARVARCAVTVSFEALTAPRMRLHRPVLVPPPKPVAWWVYALYVLAALAVLFVLFAPRSLVERLPLPQALMELLTWDSFWPGVPGGRGWGTGHAPPLYSALSRWFP